MGGWRRRAGGGGGGGLMALTSAGHELARPASCPNDPLSIEQRAERRTEEQMLEVLLGD